MVQDQTDPSLTEAGTIDMTMKDNEERTIDGTSLQGEGHPVPVIVIPGILRNKPSTSTKRVAIDEGANISDVITVESGFLHPNSDPEECESIKLSVVSGLDSNGYSEIDSKYESKLVPRLVRMLDHGCAWIEGNGWLGTFEPSSMFASDATVTREKNSRDKSFDKVLFSSNKSASGMQSDGEASAFEDHSVIDVEKLQLEQLNNVRSKESSAGSQELFLMGTKEDGVVLELSAESKETLQINGTFESPIIPEIPEAGREIDGESATKENESGPPMIPDLSAELSSASLQRMDDKNTGSSLPCGPEPNEKNAVLPECGSWTTYEKEQIAVIWENEKVCHEKESTNVQLRHLSATTSELEGGLEQPISLDNPDPVILHGDAEYSADDEGDSAYAQESDEYAALMEDYLSTDFIGDGNDSLAVVFSHDEDTQEDKEQEEESTASLLEENQYGSEQGFDYLELGVNTEIPLIEETWVQGSEAFTVPSADEIDADLPMEHQWDQEMHLPFGHHGITYGTHSERSTTRDPPDRSRETQQDMARPLQRSPSRFPRDPSPCRRPLADRKYQDRVSLDRCSPPPPRWLEPDRIRDDAESLSSRRSAADPEEGVINVINLAGPEGVQRDDFLSFSPATPSAKDKLVTYGVIEGKRAATLEAADKLKNRATMLKRKRKMREKRKNLERCLIEI